jgi:hypothetical protein
MLLVYCGGDHDMDHDPEKASELIQGGYNGFALRIGSCPSDVCPDGRSP